MSASQLRYLRLLGKRYLPRHPLALIFPAMNQPSNNLIRYMTFVASAILLAVGGCRNAQPTTNAQSDATAQRNAMAASDLQRIENDPKATQAAKERAIAQIQKTQ